MFQLMPIYHLVDPMVHNQVLRIQKIYNNHPYLVSSYQCLYTIFPWHQCLFLLISVFISFILLIWHVFIDICKWIFIFISSSGPMICLFFSIYLCTSCTIILHVYLLFILYLTLKTKCF